MRSVSYEELSAKSVLVKYRGDLIELIQQNLEAGDWEVALDDISVIERELEGISRSIDWYPTLAALRTTAEQESSM